eukprot:TRINITY_DN3516_c0_g1_i1.p1 TRINITY_DN3516_c0_g1~~TRINITY_DN3516_c0_g1_i1.p1  ORF type:complete len:1015 (+),score=192.09 TRINITY_DN3516_c0_g1_i1:82-3126(+)
MSSVTDSDLDHLFTFFGSLSDYSAAKKKKDPELQEIQDRCNALFSKDYIIHLIENNHCHTYPPEIVFLGSHDARGTEGDPFNAILSHEETAVKMEGEMQKSKNCRCRQRFPVPVIMINNKYVCRSAGLSEQLEITFRVKSENIGQSASSVATHREWDISWLKMLNIKYVCDLMVEEAVKVLGFSVCSSERTAEGHGKVFYVSGMPYPGVSAYANFIEKLQRSKTGPLKITTDYWKKEQATVSICKPFNLPKPYSWDQFKQWSAIELTQNYMRFILNLLRDPDNTAGVLIHCISGWDRTPLYVSLLRILLWADGQIHKNLSADQMLYLTIAYDWLLFGHGLSKRLHKGYQIMYFCFWILDYLRDDEFSFQFSNKDKENEEFPETIEYTLDRPPLPKISKNYVSPTLDTHDMLFKKYNDPSLLKKANSAAVLKAPKAKDTNSNLTRNTTIAPFTKDESVRNSKSAPTSPREPKEAENPILEAPPTDSRASKSSSSDTHLDSILTSSENSQISELQIKNEEPAGEGQNSLFASDLSDPTNEPTGGIIDTSHEGAEKEWEQIKNNEDITDAQSLVSEKDGPIIDDRETVTMEQWEKMQQEKNRDGNTNIETPSETPVIDDRETVTMSEWARMQEAKDNSTIGTRSSAISSDENKSLTVPNEEPLRTSMTSDHAAVHAQSNKALDAINQLSMDDFERIENKSENNELAVEERETVTMEEWEKMQQEMTNGGAAAQPKKNSIPINIPDNLSDISSPFSDVSLEFAKSTTPVANPLIESLKLATNSPRLSEQLAHLDDPISRNSLADSPRSNNNDYLPRDTSYKRKDSLAEWLEYTPSPPETVTVKIETQPEPTTPVPVTPTKPTMKPNHQTVVVDERGDDKWLGWDIEIDSETSSMSDHIEKLDISPNEFNGANHIPVTFFMHFKKTAPTESPRKSNTNDVSMSARSSDENVDPEKEQKRRELQERFDRKMERTQKIEQIRAKFMMFYFKCIHSKYSLEKRNPIRSSFLALIKNNNNNQM